MLDGDLIVGFQPVVDLVDHELDGGVAELGVEDADAGGAGQVFDSRQDAVELEPVFDVNTNLNVCILGAIDQGDVQDRVAGTYE